jgi:hypothetical protein
LTIINLSIGPVISKAVGVGDSSGTSIFDRPWATANCEEFKDGKDDANCQNDVCEKQLDSLIDYCTRAKGMHDMEYTAFIFDIVIGFVCGLIGLLHLFDLKKDFVSNTGLIGLICGIVGFVLTFVYVIFNGMVFTGQYSREYERDGDGIFAERQNDGTYKCLYGDNSGDHFAGRAKFSDLNKKQYNYKHEFYDSSVPDSCKDDDTKGWISDCSSTESTSFTPDPSACQKLYAKPIQTITNKDIFDRFLTALILSLIVCLANIGLALFGFLLFRTPSDF